MTLYAQVHRNFIQQVEVRSLNDASLEKSNFFFLIF